MRKVYLDIWSNKNMSKFFGLVYKDFKVHKVQAYQKSKNI